MCGIILVAHHNQAPRLCVCLLQRLQHRGHQGAKIVYGDFSQPYECGSRGGTGTVDQIFSADPRPVGDRRTFGPAQNESQMRMKFADPMTGQWAVGHTRYTTYSQRMNSRSEDCQPFVMETLLGKFVIAHNGQMGGNMYEIQKEKETLMRQNYNFHFESDTELLLGKISVLQNEYPGLDATSLLCKALAEIRGSAAVTGCIITKNQDIAFFGARKNANRPLFFGQRPDGLTIFASEDYMLKEYGLSKAAAVPPGVLVMCDRSGISHHDIDSAGSARHSPRHCIFEVFYFAHPLTTFLDSKISTLRKAFGRRLYASNKEIIITGEYNLVMGAPDSGTHAALGFAQASLLPLELGLIRNHYMGRSFLCETQNERERRASQKYVVDESVVCGKHVIVVDDSLVRSVTARVLTKKLRDAGARKVAFMIASPPVRHANYYGIDIVDDGSIAAKEMSPEELRIRLGLDALAYLSLEDAKAAIAEFNPSRADRILKDPNMFCTCCFDGKYWH
jgi:amidophosphoribosyltransferase